MNIDQSNQLPTAGTGQEINSSDDYDYKWCCIKPKCCYNCKHWLYVFIFICLCSVVQNLISSGIGVVILSTLEKEFYLTSFESGLFLAIFDLASFVAAPIVGYLGDLKNINRMRLISINLLFLTVGSYLIGFLIFMKSPDLSIYTTNGSVGVCLLNETANMTRRDYECQSIGTDSLQKQSSNSLKYILYFANVIIGLGSVALYSVGIAYVEMIVPAVRSAVCQAIFYGAGAIGGGLGIIITGQFLSLNSRFYLDIFKQSTLTSNSPNWIGCWWLPWLVYGFICNLLAIYVYGFPKKVAKNYVADSNTDDQNNVMDSTRTRSIKDNSKTLSPNMLTKISEKTITEPKHFDQPDTYTDVDQPIDKKTCSNGVRKFIAESKQLLCNLPFLCLILASSSEGLLLKGLLGFISKYFEFQYELSASSATLITGAIAFISVIFGTLTGALCISKFKWDTKKCTLFITVVYLVTSLAFWLLVLHCPEKKFESFNIANAENCKCDNIYNPVCYKSTETTVQIYASPCHAGCLVDLSGSNYANCSLLKTSNASLANSSTVSYSNCNQNVKCLATMIIVVGVALFVVFLTSVAFIPHLKSVIGVISLKQQSFGLGIRAGVIRLVGNFTGPIIFGVAVDSACIIWKTDCFNHKLCKLYNNEKMALLVTIIGFVCRFTTFLLTLTAFFLIKKSGATKSEQANNETKQQTKL